jgi:hypothetical protein
MPASFASGAGPIAWPVAPAPPAVPPVISSERSTDLNANRIDDKLESGLSGQGELSVASEEIVEVELVFQEPVTQHQVDEFLRLGGRITYLYGGISYGWNGIVARRSIASLPSILGPTLVQVEAARQVVPYMDTATQIGRVRPIWKEGFAGVAGGLRGDAGTTIGFIGDGIDGTHADLRGRNVYWKDISDDAEPTPVDYNGHDTIVAAAAVGTGGAGGSSTGELRFTYTYADSSYPTWGHMVDPIRLADGYVTMKSSAWWSGQAAVIDQLAWTRGTDGDDLRSVAEYVRGQSPLSLTNTFLASSSDVYCTMLADVDTKAPVENVTIVTSVKPYPGVGDGFNKFSGVAPGCRWAAVKIFGRNGSMSSNALAQSLDELVQRSADYHIEIINISHGLTFLGVPDESVSLRDKVNTVVRNGIVVVAAAGNGANDGFELFRTMADPARAALAISVGASNDENALTEYSTYGFIMPRTNVGEDYKPDLIAPGGSYLYTSIISADSGSSDGLSMDKEPNDYACALGTSFSAPFVSGCAALVIEAMEKQGIRWKYASSDRPLYVKMLLCATASETNAKREREQFNPTLSRAAAGPEGFPPGKDQQEGYGLVNPDAAVEAVCLTYALGADASAALGGGTTAKRVWARTVQLKAGCDISVSLDNPADADFDLYLYSMVPSPTGTPVILASSTRTKAGDDEALTYVPAEDGPALLAVKGVAGKGTFKLHSTQAGPPTAFDGQATCAVNASTTITLKATDDGRPNPPGAVSCTILSLPAHGALEVPGGAAITAVPAQLPGDKVVYRPAADWLGEDRFTFRADDGGVAPFAGPSNTATVTVTVLEEVILECPVLDGADDVCAAVGATSEQRLTDKYLYIGSHHVGLRFRNVKIPQGATIKQATLKIFAVSDSWATAAVDGVLKGEAADNPAAFGDTSRIVSALPTTKASKAWSWTPENAWKKSTWYESPDLSAIVQEIVNRPKWAPDNALVLLYLMNTASDGDRMFWSYESGNPAAAPRLIVTYQP